MPNYIKLNEVSQLSSRLNRVLVIGCSGGGKSTLAQRLSTTMDINYISIDRDVRWMPGWKAREASERRTIVEKLIRDKRWIMDGTYPSSFDIRLPRTDLVLWVSVPRHVALISVYKRAYKYYGTTRSDMAEGCVEQLPDSEFLSYIWNFNKITAPIVVRQLELHRPDVPVLVLNSRRAMDLLANQIASSFTNVDKQ